MGKYNKEDGVLRPMKSKKWFYRRNKQAIDGLFKNTLADVLTEAYEELGKPLSESASAKESTEITNDAEVSAHPDGWTSRFKHWLGGK